MNAIQNGLKVVDLIHDFGKRRVLDGLSFFVPPGKIVGILGPNGAGKSTAFRIVAGLLKPVSGCVFLCEHNLTPLPLWKRARLGLGYLPQESTIFRRLTVQENLQVALDALPKSEWNSLESKKNRLNECLEIVGLSERRNSKGETLSGGERRRAEIARVFCQNPKVLLCDEPFAGLDPRGIQAVSDALRALKARQIGILFSDHNVLQALDLCDEVYILQNGLCLAEGTPAQVAADPRVMDAYLGNRPSGSGLQRSARCL